MQVLLILDLEMSPKEADKTAIECSELFESETLQVITSSLAISIILIL